MAGHVPGVTSGQHPGVQGIVATGGFGLTSGKQAQGDSLSDPLNPFKYTLVPQSVSCFLAT